MDGYFNPHSGFPPPGFGFQGWASGSQWGMRDNFYDDGGGDWRRDDDQWRKRDGRKQRGGGKKDGNPKQDVKAPVCQTDSMTKILEYWQTFLASFNTCGNAISTMECSLLSAKLPFIKLSFTAQELFQCQSFHVFSGLLFVYKVSENESEEEEVLLSYGLGRNKKSVKQDAYQKAQGRLLYATVDEIMSQEALSDRSLVEEFMTLFEDDAFGYLDFLKEYGIEGEEEEGLQKLILPEKKEPPPKAVAQTLPPQQEMVSKEVKSSTKSEATGSWKKLEEIDDSKMSKPTSSATENQRETASLKELSLCDKLTQLKKLLREKGITRLHIIPKIDTFGNEVGLDIKNVFRFSVIPKKGEEVEKLPTYCELYLDNQSVSTGSVSVKPIVAMHRAYSSLVERLFKEPIDCIVNISRYWEDHMKNDRNFCRMILKQKKSGDEDPMLTNNLADIQEVMGSNPDISKSIDEFVIFEYETLMSSKNSYAILQESANRNCMFLECSIVRNKDQGFTCMLSIQGEPLSIRTSFTQTEAKRLASDATLAMLNRKSDVVFVGKNIQGPVITEKELLEKAQKSREAGREPLRCNLKLKNETRPEEGKGKLTQKDGEDSDLIQWMGRVLADSILEILKGFSLEDFQLRLQDMPDSMKFMAFTVCKKFGLRLTSSENAILYRCIPALEVTKILNVNKGTSGRFRLKQCKNPWSAKELQEYKNEAMTKYTQMYDDLLNDKGSERESNIEMEKEFDIWYRESKS